MTIDTPGIPVMSKLEEAIQSDCDCGHGGLSVAFHLGPCPFTIVRTHARLAERPDMEAAKKVGLAYFWLNSYTKLDVRIVPFVEAAIEHGVNAALHGEEEE